MAWIKLEHITPDKPEVYQIAIILRVTPEAVVGHLVRLWIWADQVSRSGRDFVTRGSDIDRIVRRKNFAEAMRKVGWLAGKSDACTIPNFERHNGQSAKKRALAANRQQTFRVTHSSRSQRGEVTEPELPDKIRIEEKEKTRFARKKESTLPVDFFVTDDMRTWAAEKAPSVDLETETANFLDHHTAKGSKFKDWTAAWRTWMRNAIKFEKRGTNGRETASDRNVRNLRAIFDSQSNSDADSREGSTRLLTPGSKPRRD